MCLKVYVYKCVCVCVSVCACVCVCAHVHVYAHARQCKHKQICQNASETDWHSHTNLSLPHTFLQIRPSALTTLSVLKVCLQEAEGLQYVGWYMLGQLEALTGIVLASVQVTHHFPENTSHAPAAIIWLRVPLKVLGKDFSGVCECLCVCVCVCICVRVHAHTHLTHLQPVTGLRYCSKCKGEKVTCSVCVCVCVCVHMSVCLCV